jgi:hypothetical protein
MLLCQCVPIPLTNIIAPEKPLIILNLDRKRSTTISGGKKPKEGLALLEATKKTPQNPPMLFTKTFFLASLLAFSNGLVSASKDCRVKNPSNQQNTYSTNSNAAPVAAAVAEEHPVDPYEVIPRTFEYHPDTPPVLREISANSVAELVYNTVEHKDEGDAVELPKGVEYIDNVIKPVCLVSRREGKERREERGK